AAPVRRRRALAAFAPLRYVTCGADGSYRRVAEERARAAHPRGLGRMSAFHGRMGMFTRALAYILSHGADGLRQASGDAVLSANYVLRSLTDVFHAPFAASGPCMHEALFGDDGLPDGITTLDIAKALIDARFHPMTVYFPLVVHGAMLIEPTESESKASLDQFIGALRSIGERARAGDPDLKNRPIFAPRQRLDEARAGRQPQLVWANAPG